eukprot:638007-Prymnesium_polylepis.1
MAAIGKPSSNRRVGGHSRALPLHLVFRRCVSAPAAASRNGKALATALVRTGESMCSSKRMVGLAHAPLTCRAAKR